MLQQDAPSLKRRLKMKIKSTVAGLVFAASMVAVVGVSQAGCGGTYCPFAPGFSGTGWHMVPCNSGIPQAVTWEQYVSGGYAPPAVGSRHGFFW